MNARRNALGLFALGLWCATAAVAVVHAQSTAPANVAVVAPLTDDGLKAMLIGLGYAPTKLSKGYQIVIKRSDWTYTIQVLLSDNRSKLGMNTIVRDLKHPDNVPASAWLGLLETNPDIDPTTFYFDKQADRLFMHRALDNRGVTTDLLKTEIETFCADVAGTSRTWRFKVPAGA
jgi:hypothetical protein